MCGSSATPKHTPTFYTPLFPNIITLEIPPILWQNPTTDTMYNYTFYMQKARHILKEIFPQNVETQELICGKVPVKF